MDAQEIINLIANSKKTTPIKAYIKGEIERVNFGFLENYAYKDWAIVFGEYEEYKKFYEENKKFIKSQRIECDRRNSAIPMANLLEINARIEPGAIIREMTKIGNQCVIMMGAVINIGAEIGDYTMIDMNAVIGGRAIVGRNCHIGAGAVLAGVIEPPSAKPVVVEDNVLIGAKAVVLEGVRVGRNSVVAAGAIVTKDVEPFTVAAGCPAKVIKKIDEVNLEKISLVEELRKL